MGGKVGNPSSWLGGLGGNGIVNPGGSGVDFVASRVVPYVVNILVYAIISMSLLFLIIGGVMYITSSGNKEAMSRAKGAITYALIGLILGLGSFIILHILGVFLGSNLV